MWCIILSLFCNTVNWIVRLLSGYNLDILCEWECVSFLLLLLLWIFIDISFYFVKISRQLWLFLLYLFIFAISFLLLSKMVCFFFTLRKCDEHFKVSMHSTDIFRSLRLLDKGSLKLLDKELCSLAATAVIRTMSLRRQNLFQLKLAFQCRCLNRRTLQFYFDRNLSLACKEIVEKCLYQHDQGWYLRTYENHILKRGISSCGRVLWMLLSSIAVCNF